MLTEMKCHIAVREGQMERAERSEQGFDSVQESTGFWGIGVLISVLPPTSCVTWDKSFALL